MKVLIACEESQEVCKAFRSRGHEAYSCDVQEPSGGHPEWHILGDALEALNVGKIVTMDGIEHNVGKWDMLIAHPPCTFLTVSGNRWFNVERYGDKAVERLKARKEAAEFFMAFIRADIPRVCVENPVGYMSTHYRKPDCIVQPYQFGHPSSKKTCLWLKGLPLLQPTDIVEPCKTDKYGFSEGSALQMARDENGKILRWNDPRTAKARSKTYPGIAKAMAEQWG